MENNDNDNANANNDKTRFIVITRNAPLKKYSESEMVESTSSAALTGLLLGGLVAGLTVHSVMRTNHDRELRTTQSDRVAERIRLEGQVAAAQVSRRAAEAELDALIKSTVSNALSPTPKTEETKIEGLRKAFNDLFGDEPAEVSASVS